MSLNIKNFTVLNTSTGQMPISGRMTSSVLSTINSFNKITTGTTNDIQVPGTPSTISNSSALYGNAHMCSSYIKIIRQPYNITNVDVVYIPDGFIRISYITGFCSFENTILYGFANSTSTALSDITFNVAFASSTSQTYGDYVDISLPGTAQYPTLYLVIISLVNVWSSRTIVSGNTCSINSNNAKYMFCVDPSKSTTDVGTSHFIIIQGTNSIYNMFSHIVIAPEDNSLTNVVLPVDFDYNDCTIAVGSRDLWMV